jgi:hypothetical protein
MIPLIMGQTVRVSPSGQAAIAAWAVLKAMVAEYAESEIATTHHMQRKYMMRWHLPPKDRWSVWIAHYRGNGDISWLSRPFLVLPNNQAARRPTRDATYFNGQATTQIIGQLLIHVIRSPHPGLAKDFKFRLPRSEALFRIWPPTQHSLIWPVGTLGDEGASYVASAVSDFLAKIGEERIRGT